MWTKYDGQEGEILQIDKTVFDKQYLYLQFLIALVDMYLSFYLCGVNVGVLHSCKDTYILVLRSVPNMN